MLIRREDVEDKHGVQGGFAMDIMTACTYVSNLSMLLNLLRKLRGRNETMDPALLLELGWLSVSLIERLSPHAQQVIHHMIPHLAGSGH